MQELDDNALLRQYTGQNSEEAFAALVARHVNKVYSVALRHTRNPHHAEEITQAVFVILARKAHTLGRNVVLSGWLYQTARLTAVTFVRSEIRRARREQEACMQTMLNETESDAWPRIAPLLDAAMADLSQADHHAVVLRFFDGKSMKEVGTMMGASEDAAKMRLNRAVDKLRRFFTKRGVALPAAALTAAISSNSVQAAPLAVAKTATVVALAKGAAASGSTLALIHGALKVMAWTKAKTAALTAGAVILAIGTTAVVVRTIQAANVAGQPDIQGTWQGAADVPLETETVHMRAVLKLHQVNGVYQGTVDSIDQGVKNLQLSRVEYDHPQLHIDVIKDVSGFDGTVNKDGSEITGTYREPNIQVPIVLKRTDHPDTTPDRLKKREYTPRAGSELQGLWKGVLNVPGRAIRLNFKIAELTNGTFRGEMDNLDGNRGQWLLVTYQPPTLKLLVVHSGAGLFQGQWDAGKTKFTGHWIEGGDTFPLTLERAVPAYHPIPDHEPEVTARVRGIKLGELRAEECTPDFWQQYQQSQLSQNPEVAKAIIAALGELRAVSLVERTNNRGRPSYLYRMEYENMNVLIRIVLDGNKIAEANGNQEPE